MSFSASNLTRRNGVYYFRARVPAEYISAFGRSMVSISLQTSDELEARLRAGVHRRDLDLALKALGQEKRELSPGYTGPLLHVTEADVEHVCKSYRAQMLTQDELQRIAGKHASEADLEIELFTYEVESQRKAYARGDFSRVYESLGTYLRKHGPRVLPATPGYERLVRAFQLAEIEVYEAILQRRLGKSVAIPLAPAGGETYESVFKRWQVRKDNRNTKTVEAFEDAYAAMRLHCTAISPSMLAKEDAVHLRDCLLAERQRSRPTIAKMIGFLHAIFQCSVNDGKFSVNPFKGVEVTIDEKAKVNKSRIPFSKEELAKLFESEIFQPGFKPRKSLGNICFWAPLLALHVGARLEEIAQLHAEDIQYDKELKTYYVRIHDEGNREVKTASSIRNIPVHPELVKIGFITLVDNTKTGRLFPALTADKYGILSTVFSTWFGRFMDDIGLNNPQLVFHSFRHSFVQLCKRKAHLIPAEVREAILGHIPPTDIIATYGTALYPLEPMVEAMTHIDFGIDFSRLYPTKVEAPEGAAAA